jgi:chorismate synthase
MTKPRPGHADLTGAVKYGYSDLRLALERASARETATRVGIGAICKQFLHQFDICVGGYVREIGGISAKIEEDDFTEVFEAAEISEVRCADPFAAEAIQKKIAECIDEGDTLGGVIEAVVLNVPAGLGSYVQADRRLDARLAGAIISIPGIKGIEIGDAYNNTRRSGLDVSDEIILENKQLIRTTNLAGGIEGGISNGMPIKLRAAMKPVATTLKPKKTVDLATGDESQTSYERSDFCPVPRAVPVVEAITAMVIADALIEKLGGDSMAEMIPRFKSLREASLDGMQMNGNDKVWWE